MVIAFVSNEGSCRNVSRIAVRPHAWAAALVSGCVNKDVTTRSKKEREAAVEGWGKLLQISAEISALLENTLSLVKIIIFLQRGDVLSCAATVCKARMDALGLIRLKPS